MKFIIFQKFNFNYIYFLLYFITCLAIDLIDSHIKKHNNPHKGRGHFNEVITLFVVSLSDFLAIIPLKIKKYLSQRKNEIFISNSDDKSNKSGGVYIYYNKAQDEKKKKMKALNFYTFLSGFFDFLAKTLLFLYLLQFNNDFYYIIGFEVSFQITLQYFLSVVILNEHFYKHHLLSMLINIIVLIVLCALDIIDEMITEWHYEFCYLLILLFLVLENTFGKKAMIFGYISPYTLLILIAIYKNILMFIFLVLYVPIMATLDENFFNDIKDFNYEKVLFLLLNFVLNFLKNLFNWILIDRFSPSHLALSLILENVSYNFVTIINLKEDNEEELDKELHQIIIRIVLYVILFIAAMIHNEIFIITKCDLGSKTKLFLEKKQEEERLLSFSNDINFLKRYDTVMELESKGNEDNEGENVQDNKIDEKNGKE